MSHLPAVSSTKSIILSSLASFVGMLAAVPVSLAIFSAAQPAQAMQAQPSSDASYAQYVQAYTKGYLASTHPQSSGCSEETTPPAEGSTASYQAEQTPPVENNYAPMSHEEWTKTVVNSYNDYVTKVDNSTHIHNTKNINSNNTANSTVVVSHSDGAVVTSNTSAAGSNFNHVDVDNNHSNNDTDIDVTTVVKDSFNEDNSKTTNTTNNTAVVNDSFNHEVTNVNSNNTVQDNSHTYIKTEDNDTHIHV